MSRFTLLLLATILLIGTAAQAQTTQPTSTTTSSTISDFIWPRGAARRLGFSQFAAGGTVTSVEFSADDSRILTTHSGDGVRLWNTASGQCVTLFENPGRNSAVRALFLNPNTVAIGWSGGQITLNETVNGKIVQAFSYGNTGMAAMAASPDGKRLVVLSKNLSLWNTENGTLILDLGDFGNAEPFRTFYQFLTFSPDSRTFYSVHAQRGLEAWDATDGRSKPLPPGIGGLKVLTGAISPDGTTLAVFERTLKLFNLIDGSAINPPGLFRKLAGGGTTVQFTPTGQLAVFIAGQLTLWDIKQDQEIHALPTLQRAAWSHNGKLVAGAENFRVVLREVETGKLLTRHAGHNAPIQSILASADGGEIVTIDSHGYAIRWDARTGRMLQVIPEPLQVAAQVVYSDDGSRLFVKPSTRPAAIVDLTNPDQLKPIATAPAARNTAPPLAVSGDLELGLSAGDARTLSIWELSSGKLVANLTRPEGGAMPGSYAAFSPTATQVAVQLGNGVGVWRVSVGQPLKQIEFTAEVQLRGIEWSADGNLIVAQHTAGAYCINTREWRIAGTINANRDAEQDGQTLKIAISPDSRLAGVVTRDRVELLDLAGGAVVRIAVPNAQINAATFVNNSSLIAVGLSDGTAMMFEMSRLLRSAALESRTPSQLWGLLGVPAASENYLAGAALLRRPKEFVQLARERIDLATFAPDKWEALTAKLSSPDTKQREAAHRELERGGAGAATAVAKAMKNPPGGETEERLRSLARILGIPAEPPAAEPPARREGPPPPPPNPRQAPAVATNARAIQMLEWLGNDEASAFLSEIAAAGSDDAANAVRRISARRSPTTRASGSLRPSTLPRQIPPTTTETQP